MPEMSTCNGESKNAYQLLYRLCPLFRPWAMAIITKLKVDITTQNCQLGSEIAVTVNGSSQLQSDAHCISALPADGERARGAALLEGRRRAEGRPDVWGGGGALRSTVPHSQEIRGGVRLKDSICLCSSACILVSKEYTVARPHEK